MKKEEIQELNTKRDVKHNSKSTTFSKMKIYFFEKKIKKGIEKKHRGDTPKRKFFFCSKKKRNGDKKVQTNKENKEHMQPEGKMEHEKTCFLKREK